MSFGVSCYLFSLPSHSSSVFFFIDSPGTRSLQLFIASPSLFLSCLVASLSNSPERLADCFSAWDQIITLQSLCQLFSFLFLLSRLLSVCWMYWWEEMLCLCNWTLFRKAPDFWVWVWATKHFFSLKIILLIICYEWSFFVYTSCIVYRKTLKFTVHCMVILSGRCTQKILYRNGVAPQHFILKISQ